ncbi:hypothetical protein B0H16DRAFT_1797983 [Mycena metata]|uniref:G-protein coupled receptors family 2 profile 2 domain-containing protein n=1 Tax=Mycena metata TaxID=1033252 RepID=A0AAD7JIM7_9AGAR|nr:hypothetical protein B0H16DRAFT_1797983 [Mycena metata]
MHGLPIIRCQDPISIGLANVAPVRRHHVRPGRSMQRHYIFRQWCAICSLGLCFSVWLLNLQLVLIHGVNGQRMEKYYILGAVALPLACSIPPYAAGAFGYWAVNDTCWYNSPDPAAQLRWWVGTLGFWMFLMSAGEVASFLVVVGSMASLDAQGEPPRFLMIVQDHPPPCDLDHLNWNFHVVLHYAPASPITAYRCVSPHNSANRLLRSFVDQEYYRNGNNLMVYALRPIAYSLLAATDPSFLRALPGLRGSESKASVQVNLYAKTWRSSAPSSAGRPSMNSDTELGPNTIKA